jgi:hypothetical protein
VAHFNRLVNVTSVEAEENIYHDKRIL